MRIPMALAALLTLTGACTSDPTTTAAADATTTAATDATATAATDVAAPDTADTAVVVDRGPTTIALDADPNGLWWDAATGTLYIADDNGNRILAWSDGATGTRLVTELPSPSPEGPGLGQLVALADGRLVVTRFGYGSTGDVVVVARDGTASIVAGLDPTRRRIGLAVAPDGALYTSWFVKSGQGPRVGAVGRLELGDTPTETAVLEGLKKPVGVLATATNLIVSDQDLGQIVTADRASPTSFAVRAMVEGPDLLAAGPAGSVFTGGTGGAVRQVALDGTVTSVATGFRSVRGVAWDDANHRLFVAEHDPDETDGIDHAIHIVPID